MERQLVSSDELAKLLNQRVRQLAKIPACAVSGVLRLHKAADDGCNWEEIPVRGTQSPGFRQALNELRATYNLADSFERL
jgi:hypothetical protein